MGCFEKDDLLNQHFGISEADGEYHEVGVGILEIYEKLVGAYSYAIAAFEDSQTRLEWSNNLIETRFTIISLIFPKAYVSPFIQIIIGCIIEPLSDVSFKVLVGVCSAIEMRGH